jgi:hypothetical protein
MVVNLESIYKDSESMSDKNIDLKFESVLNKFKFLVDNYEKLSNRKILDNAETYDRSKIYEVYLSLYLNKQYYDSNVKNINPYIADRLIKVNVNISKSIYSYHDQKIIMLGGLYTNVKLYIIPLVLYNKCICNSYKKSIQKPEKYGLLPTNVANYATLKIQNGSFATCFLKENWMSEYIQRPYQYQYIYLKI